MSDPGLREALTRVLGEAPADLRPVGGGDICHAFAVTARDGARWFAKTPREPRPGLLSCEARGLAWLAEGLGGDTGPDGPGERGVAIAGGRGLRVPRVLGVAEARGGGPAVLVLEWIESGRPAADHDEQLGRGLAALHAAGAPAFGLDRDNWIGTLPQPNAARPDWPAFYRDQRLAPLLRRARDAGRMGAELARRADALLARLGAICGPPEPPARLHGDLWAGNRMVDAAGAPCLVDPAVYGGHREMDLAMMRLFGGFPPACFRAYEEAFPLAPGHGERVPLCQLHPLLVHVNLFGGGYAASFEDALARCEAL